MTGAPLLLDRCAVAAAVVLTCVLFTCLTGHAPYLGSVTEVIDGHLAGEVPSAAEIAGLDPRIDDVVRRGMDPDRPRRHDSAGAVDSWA